MVFLDQIVVESVHLCGQDGGIEISDGSGSTGTAEGGGEAGIGEDPVDSGVEDLGMGEVEEQAVFAVFDECGGAGGAVRNSRRARGPRFEDNQTEGLGDGGKENGFRFLKEADK